MSRTAAALCSLVFLHLALRAHRATAQRDGEPAWHRRQRRARAQARVLVRVAAAKALLGAHHSAQRRATRPAADLIDNARMASNRNDALKLIPGVSRYPLWSCGKCGGADNWGDRVGCRFCFQEPPSSVRRRQQESKRRGAADAGATVGKGGGGGIASNSTGGGGKGGPGAKRPPNRGTTGGRSYAEALAGGRGAAADPSITTELQELRRSNDRLVRQLEQARAAAASQRAKDDDEEDGDEAAEEQERARDDQIKNLQSNMRALVALFGEDSPEHRRKRDELDALLKAKREGRPLKTQLQNVDRRIDRQKARVEKLDAQVGRICSDIAELREELEKVEGELTEAKETLAATEEERKSLLLREAQAQSDGSQPGAEGSKLPDGEREWSSMCALIRDRAGQPGVHAELASQVSSALELLRQLCWQLPAANSQPAAAPAAATNASKPSAQCTAGGAAEDARQVGRDIAQQVRRDMEKSAAARRAAKAETEAAAIAPTLQATLPSGAGAGSAASSSNTGAAPSDGGPPPPSCAPSQHGAATAPPATAATAAAAAAAVATAQGSAPPVSAEAIDSLEEASTADEGDMECEDEAIVEAASPEQKTRLKELLERRRIRTARRRNGSRGPKKPRLARGSPGSEASAPKC